MNIITTVFVNASQHAKGATSEMGRQYLRGNDYQQLNLVEYRINQLNQQYQGDQFSQVFSQLKAADWIVLGTPVYWHHMSAYLQTLLERLSQDDDFDALRGKRLSILIQGSDPSDTIGPVTRIIQRFAGVAKMEFVDLQEA
ncbi:hypothetical protein KIM372_04250 [Bombiscardovia nodaiensis]|uniref:NADPH-dependent FMN reductase-like domain-containing protein n=1 Tax=Bombiscardovia nodaiensis TaxID=2932181 RepID=A0ABN6SBC3_9BIFI|nr:hypothetical protein KIM372_04250 [Bombiscardovia nodaiensis]